MQCEVRCECYDVPGYAIDDMNQYGGFTGVQTVQAAAALNEAAGELTVFVINADPAEEQELRLDVRGFEEWRFTEHIEMFTDSAKAANTWDHPDRIVPRVSKGTRAEKGILTARLQKQSWNVFRFKKQ